MVAVVVSSANRCYYCLVAHGQAVRKLSGDAELGEMMVMNYRVAKLDRAPARHARFRLEAHDGAARCRRGRPRRSCARVGLSDEDIFDLAETVAFFNMSNRMAYARRHDAEPRIPPPRPLNGVSHAPHHRWLLCADRPVLLIGCSSSASPCWSSRRARRRSRTPTSSPLTSRSRCRNRRPTAASSASSSASSTICATCSTRSSAPATTRASRGSWRASARASSARRRLQELRDAIAAFRAKGKFALAFADSFGEFGPGTRAYYLGSAFDEIWLQPLGEVGLIGLRVETPFFRGALDKLGIAAALRPSRANTRRR